MDSDDRDVDVRWERIEGHQDPIGRLRLVLDGSGHRFPVLVRGLISAGKGPGGIGRSRSAGSLDFATESETAAEPVLLAVPTNDQCSGAAVIPGSGPFPYLSAAYDITDATATGDPPVPSCQSNVSNSIWFAFTPAASGLYTFSVCEDGPTQTTVPDTVLAISSSTGACQGFAELARDAVAAATVPCGDQGNLGVTVSVGVAVTPGGELSPEEFRTGLKKSILHHQVFPVFAASGLANIGAQTLLNGILAFLPSPVEAGAVKAAIKGEEKTVPPAPDAPFAALVFKTISDPYTGRISLMRVFSGRTNPDGTVHNATRDTEEKLGGLFFLQGKEQVPAGQAKAGDIVATARLKVTATGDGHPNAAGHARAAASLEEQVRRSLGMRTPHTAQR